MFNKNDKWFQIVVLAVIAMYGMLGNAGSLFSGIELPKPKFSSLALARYSERSGYTLRFLEIDDEMLSAPLYFNDLAEMLDLDDRPAARRLIGRLGSAQYDGDSVLVESLRAELERTWLSELNSADYELIFRVPNPVERFTMDESVAEQILAKFRLKPVIASLSTP